MPSLPSDYQYDGNDSFTGTPDDPENVGEFRHEERITTLEGYNADTRLTALETEYSCRVYINLNENINDSTDTLIVWDAEDFDNGGFWSSGSTLTVPVGGGGMYMIVGQVEWDSNTSAKRQAKIEVNGSNIAWVVTEVDIASMAQQVSAIYQCDDGDTIGLEVHQTSGTARTCAANRTWLSVARIHA